MSRATIAAEDGTARDAGAELPPSTGAGSQPSLDGLADALGDLLPDPGQVVLHWRGPAGFEGFSASSGASATLVAHAAQCLDGDARAGPLDAVWNEGDIGIAIVASPNAAQPAHRRDAWLALARRSVSAAVAAARAQARIESMEKSQRLQHALYEIADLAGSGLEMDEMLRRIHAVVGDLMYASNCFIVIYDDVRQTIRFLYFADALDPYVAEPDVEISIDALPNSLTVALLHGGIPLMGPSARLRRDLGVQLDLSHGPDSADWLGVPMRRDGRVSGAIVVQSYDRPGLYSDEDRVLLEFVAQHIQTALDRKHAQVELERHVYERTLELQQANLVLQAEIIERKRAERLQRALYKITELSVTAGSQIEPRGRSQPNPRHVR